MTLDDFEIQGDTLYYNDAASVDDAENQLGMRMPAGYRDFVTRFGEGTLANYVRVYPPYQILTGDNSVNAWRKRVDEYWFWDDGAHILPKDKALQCIIVADTLDGDEIVAHPSDPDRLYVLPRYEETVYVASEGGLLPALQWLLTSGVLTEPVEDRRFEPFDGQAESGT